jgi:hypothetical protein
MRGLLGLLYGSSSILAALLNFVPGRAYAEEDPPEIVEARALLLSNQVGAASAKYVLITPTSRAWPIRTEDAIRYNLLTKHYQDAWRLTQLAKRTDLAISELDYYASLSAVKAGGCPFGFSVSNPRFAALIHAYTYRFPQRFINKTPDIDPFEEASMGVAASYLQSSRTFRLRELQGAKIIKGAGCSFLAKRLGDDAQRMDFEFRHLNVWLEITDGILKTTEGSGPTNVNSISPPAEILKFAGSEEVKLRLLELASKLKKTELVDRLVKPFLDYSEGQWIQIKAPENRFIWQKLVEAGLIGPLPLASDSKLGKIVKSIILASKDPEAVYWLGAVNFEKWPLKTQLEVVNHLLENEKIKQRPYLLRHKAWVMYFMGKFPDALAIVREITVEGASDGDKDVERSVVDLAMAVFAEYRYDKSLMGTIQASLSAEYWGEAFRGILVDNALSGNAKNYQIIKDFMSDGNRRRIAGVSRTQMPVLDALVARKFSEFQRLSSEWRRGRGLSSDAVHLSEILAKGVFALSAENRQQINSYLQSLAELLLQGLNHGGDQKHLEELIRLFDPENATAWSKGHSEVQQGSIKVGVANLRDPFFFEKPYTWKAPESLPRRELLFVPKSTGDRDWIIE